MLGDSTAAVRGFKSGLGHMTGGKQAEIRLFVLAGPVKCFNLPARALCRRYICFSGIIKDPNILFMLACFITGLFLFILGATKVRAAAPPRPNIDTA